MSGLLELQQQAAAAFLGEDPSPGSIQARGIPADVRVEIYRNNLRENYRKCLANAYPVVERLVGPDCFRGIAAHYSRAYQSTSGDLQDFGGKLPELLHELYGDTKFCYLPDVAQLEWAIEEALIAPRTEAMRLDELAEIEASDVDHVQFLLRPGLSLVRSRFPILAIWRANRREDDGVIDLDSGGDALAVFREGDAAEIRQLDADAFALAECLAAGLRLGKSIARLDGRRGFDPGQSLNFLFSNRCIAGFVLASGDHDDR